MTKSTTGRMLAHAIITRLRPQAAIVRETLGRSATLAIVASSDPDGQRFIQVKRDALADIDFIIEPAWLDDTASTADAVACVNEFNTRNDVDAIFIQFPLPPQIDAGVVADAIAIEKDIDCSGQRAFERFANGHTPFTPVAPHAAFDLLVKELGSIEGRRIVMADEDEFARALALLLTRHGAIVRTGWAEADALVVVQQWPQTTAPVVLDAGYYLPPRPPDWIPAPLHETIAVYLTQYGNVGPLTIAHLFEGTLRAAERRVHRVELP